jgi:hypothetical protein
MKLCYVAGADFDPGYEGYETDLSQFSALLGRDYAPLLMPSGMGHDDERGLRTAYLGVAQECWCFYYEVPQDDVVLAAAQARGLGLVVRWFHSGDGGTLVETEPPVDVETEVKSVLAGMKPGSVGYDSQMDELLGTALQDRDSSAEEAWADATRADLED